MQKYYYIEWVVIKKLRNKIVHDYDGINLVLIWSIIENDICTLKKDLEKVLET